MKIPLNHNTKAEVLGAIDTALESGKSYAVEIKLFDSSLRARQRALANIWYKYADEHFGNDTGYAEAYCKWAWGINLIGEDDSDVRMMTSRMLEGQEDQVQIEIIRTMSAWFPIMRAKGGLDAERQAIYLNSIQRGMAEYGCILSSPREDDLLKCRQAQR